MPRLWQLFPGICLTTEEKARKTSVRVAEKCPDIPVAVVQYTFTHKQYTEQHSETEYTERNIQGDSGEICNTLGNDNMCDSKLKCSYELFCLESHILSFPKVLQIPPESPCI
jgi:hypothetical protein